MNKQHLLPQTGSCALISLHQIQCSVTCGTSLFLCEHFLVSEWITRRWHGNAASSLHARTCQQGEATGCRNKSGKLKNNRLCVQLCLGLHFTYLLNVPQINHQVHSTDGKSSDSNFPKYQSKKVYWFIPIKTTGTKVEALHNFTIGKCENIDHLSANGKNWWFQNDPAQKKQLVRFEHQ